MKRFAAVLLVLVPVSFFVAGCGRGGGTNPAKSLKPEEMKPPSFTKKFETFQKTPPPPGVKKYQK